MSRLTLRRGKKIRYAVVGAGYISQVAVLPAFEHASLNSELTALVSGDDIKLTTLQRKYNIPNVYSYDQYDECLQSGEIDAVYIALPNNMHREYTVRAAEAGIHVLCEKPMAVTADECAAMIKATRENKVKLMIAYRLHFEESNLRAVEIIRSGKIGEPRIFNSVFTMQVKPGDIRLQKKLGGGNLYDLGVYCINAARYLFEEEPIEVTTFTGTTGEKRFKEVGEMTSVIMRFPDDKLATFTSSFGAADTALYHVVGTHGELRLDPAYEYAEPVEGFFSIDGKKTLLKSKKRDQFAPELLYFSKCILEDIEPEPSGEEGMTDVKIIEALNHSARTGRSVKLQLPKDHRWPSLRQEIRRPAVKKPELVHAASPHLE